jgi:hypothetical protein
VVWQIDAPEQAPISDKVNLGHHSSLYGDQLPPATLVLEGDEQNLHGVSLDWHGGRARKEVSGGMEESAAPLPPRGPRYHGLQLVGSSAPIAMVVAKPNRQRTPLGAAPSVGRCDDESLLSSVDELCGRGWRIHLLLDGSMVQWPTHWSTHDRAAGGGSNPCVATAHSCFGSSGPCLDSGHHQSSHHPGFDAVPESPPTIGGCFLVAGGRGQAGLEVEASGQYSSSSAYAAMFLGQSALHGAKELWKVRASNDADSFFWLAIQDRC